MTSERSFSGTFDLIGTFAEKKIPPYQQGKKIKKQKALPASYGGNSRYRLYQDE